MDALHLCRGPAAISFSNGGCQTPQGGDGLVEANAIGVDERDSALEVVTFPLCLVVLVT